MRVRVATLEAIACCTVTARLPAEGWVIARLVPWGSGWLLVAYADGAQRLSERHGETSIAVFESTNAMPMMWRVLEGRFAPHAQLADYVLKSRKPL